MRRGGQPQTRTPVKVLGEHADDIRKLKFRMTRAGWRFNVDNQGGWGYVQTNDCVDLDTLPDPCAIGGEWGWVVEDASGCGVAIASTTEVRVKSDGILGLDCETSPLTITVNGQQFSFKDDGTIQLPSGAVIGP